MYGRQEESIFRVIDGERKTMKWSGRKNRSNNCARRQKSSGTRRSFKKSKSKRAVPTGRVACGVAARIVQGDLWAMN